MPDEARLPFEEAAERGRAEHGAWRERRAAWAKAHPDLAAELERRLAGTLPPGWDEGLPTYPPGAPAIATRSASGAVINALAPRLPELCGGSADLAESNSTNIKGAADFSAQHPEGRNLRFGVREHAMAAILNGMTLSGLIRPFGGTFLVFSDYMRPAVRLAALMKLPVVYVFTHDSILLGEDGPTHQPEAHLAALRAMPQHDRVCGPATRARRSRRGGSRSRTAEGPTALILTRQKLPVLEATAGGAAEAGVPRGGYVAREPGGATASGGARRDPDRDRLRALARARRAGAARSVRDRRARGQPAVVGAVRAAAGGVSRGGAALARCARRLAIEAASPFGWERWVGDHGAVLGQTDYGASAPYQDLAKHFGFTPENVAAKVRALLER